jgi:hypothetical protein
LNETKLLTFSKRSNLGQKTFLFMRKITGPSLNTSTYKTNTWKPQETSKGNTCPVTFAEKTTEKEITTKILEISAIVIVTARGHQKRGSIVALTGIMDGNISESAM